MDAHHARTFQTADLHDQQPDDVQVVDLQFRNFGRHGCFHGRIETLRVFADHSAVRDIVAEPGEGRVLVVDVGGDLTTGVMGDRIAGKAVEAGWAGAVIVGVVRDSQAINRLPFGVRALGTTARRSLAGRAGQRGIALHIGGVHCEPGDWLYADEDAVIISKRPLTLVEVEGEISYRGN